jgi:hypothetical protein
MRKITIAKTTFNAISIHSTIAGGGSGISIISITAITPMKSGEHGNFLFFAIVLASVYFYYSALVCHGMTDQKKIQEFKVG